MESLNELAWKAYFKAQDIVLKKLYLSLDIITDCPCVYEKAAEQMRRQRDCDNCAKLYSLLREYLDNVYVGPACILRR